MQRLQLQLLFVLGAALSVIALSVVLISNAIGGALGVVISESRKTLSLANSELDQQYSYRVSSDSSWVSLPVAAQDVSLRALSQATLRSYPGVEGGYFVHGAIIGYSYPTHGSGTRKIDVPEAELPQIRAAIDQAVRTGQGERILRGSRDLVVIDALARGDHVAWTMKRLAGLTDPGERRRRVLLVCLVLAALISITGTIATVFGLRRGLAELQSGMARLESDLDFELPAQSGELGRISKSVNRVAAARRKLEAELRREDRLRALGRLAANIAHEIRNPLNSMRLTMQMLKQKMRRDPLRAEDLDLVIEEVDRLNGLLTDLLAFGQKSTAILEAQPLLPIIDRCVQRIKPQADERDIQIEVRASGRQICARVEEKQLSQVLTNLLLNSIAAISRQGNIVIDLQRDGHFSVIEIQDSGPGIAPEHREHVFEAFYTTRPGGTGLGLAVSRELIQGMGGALSYRDGEPGAIFSLRFPAAE
jgi:signal transduction histidine kinase